jgi:lactoylglutathione lyase
MKVSAKSASNGAACPGVEATSGFDGFLLTGTNQIRPGMKGIHMEPTTSFASWRLGDLHHLGLTVADIERSIHFYRDLLGMTLIRRRPHADNDYLALQTGYPGVVLNVASFKVSPDSPQSLEVVQYMNHVGSLAETATNRPGNIHLCLTVDDLRACHADLKSKGVRFKSEPVAITAGPNAGGLVVYFYDPDGYTLELFQPVKSVYPHHARR